jgi:hypothetical protein
MKRPYFTPQQREHLEAAGEILLCCLQAFAVLIAFGIFLEALFQLPGGYHG